MQVSGNGGLNLSGFPERWRLAGWPGVRPAAGLPQMFGVLRVVRRWFPEGWSLTGWPVDVSRPNRQDSRHLR